jgi:hypothetical protein
LLAPQIASEMREIIAEYPAEQVYSTARQEIQDKIRATAIEKLGHKTMDPTDPADIPDAASMGDAVILFDTLLYGIELPAPVVQAINRKAEQYYVAQEYEFRLDRERKESERKAIEAQGIHEFQQIVSQGISDSYLRLRGVEATLQLAQSNNSKVVIIGGGKDGLPIILGNVDTSAPARGAPRPGDGAAAEERTTAAAPAVPLEKTPAAGLTMPAEKMPVADSSTPREKTPAAGPATPSAAPPGEPRSFLSDLEALLSQALRSTDAKTESPAKSPFERSPEEQPR